MEDEELDVVEDVQVVDEPVVEKPVKVKTAKVVDLPDFVRAEPGDSYLSIAEQFRGDAKLKDFARALMTINNGAVVGAGMKIYLKEIR